MFYLLKLLLITGLVVDLPSTDKTGLPREMESLFKTGLVVDFVEPDTVGLLTDFELIIKTALLYT